MKKQIIRALLLALPLFSVLQLSAQNNQNRYAVKYKNTFLVGMNFAMNSSSTTDQISYFYRNEYIRRLSRLFEAGLGLGFYNYQKADPMFTDWYGPGEKYDILTQTSIVSLDAMGYIDVVDSRRRFLRFGLGYSVRFVKDILPGETYTLVNDFGKRQFTTEYIQEKGADGGLLVHLEYGRRITPHFAPSISARYYSQGKYVMLSMIGVNLSYSF